VTLNFVVSLVCGSSVNPGVELRSSAPDGCVLFLFCSCTAESLLSLLSLLVLFFSLSDSTSGVVGRLISSRRFKSIPLSKIFLLRLTSFPVCPGLGWSSILIAVVTSEIDSGGELGILPMAVVVTAGDRLVVICMAAVATAEDGFFVAAALSVTDCLVGMTALPFSVLIGPCRFSIKW